MNEATRTFLFTIAGTIVGALSSIAITLITKRSEERRHTKETIIRTAVENWKGALDFAKFKGRGLLAPLDAYIISTIALFDKVDFRKLKADQISSKLEEVKKISKAAIEWFKKDSEEK